MWKEEKRMFKELILFFFLFLSFSPQLAESSCSLFLSYTRLRLDFCPYQPSWFHSSVEDTFFLGLQYTLLQAQESSNNNKKKKRSEGITPKRKKKTAIRSGKKKKKDRQGLFLTAGVVKGDKSYLRVPLRYSPGGL